MKKIRFHFLPPIAFLSLFFFAFSSCNYHIDVYEKTVTIPKYEWQYNLVPAFQFNISDTSAQYNIYIALRHTDAYNYNNICLNVGMQPPGDSIRYQKVDLPLGNDATG